MPTASSCMLLSGVPAVMAAGVAQVTAAWRWTVMMVTGEVTLLEKVGLETVAVTGAVMLDALPVALPGTLTVITIPSLA